MKEKTSGFSEKKNEHNQNKSVDCKLAWQQDATYF